jgi:hypothetical protein
VRSSLYPSSEFSLDFLIIGSDTGFADDQLGGPVSDESAGGDDRAR